jgi:hypothetical protein
MSIFKKLFGPSKEEIWQQFCDQTSSQFIEGGFLRDCERVKATHGEWTITLDTYVVPAGKTVIYYTRIRAPYVNPDGFRFNVYRKSIFTDIKKRFGMQDVSVGHEDFDRDFVIQGTDEQKLRRLFSNQKIRDLIMAQPNIQFSVKDKDDEALWKNISPDVDELFFRVVGDIKDIAWLKLLYELFSETLDELCMMGSAYKQAPQVQL